LVLSDSEAGAGSKTIARFTDVKGTLSSSGTVYSANVDLRFKDQSNKEALVAGKVALQDVDTMTVAVDYTFNQSPALKAGETVSGNLEVNTREGETLNFGLSCQRYLKN
jgi:hypothetical protein